MRDLIFMGRVLATSTHDMQNILAIVKESGCLVSDVLAINNHPKMKHGDKLSHSLVVINEQIERGKELLFSLNSFAHAASDQHISTDLAVVGRQAANLATRMVRLKDCSLEIKGDSNPLSISAQPFFVIEAIFVAIAQILSCVKNKTNITMQIAQKGVGNNIYPAVTFSGTCDNVKTDLEASAELIELMAELNGKCTVEDNTLTLAFVSMQANN